MCICPLHFYTGFWPEFQSPCLHHWAAGSFLGLLSHLTDLQLFSQNFHKGCFLGSFLGLLVSRSSDSRSTDGLFYGGGLCIALCLPQAPLSRSRCLGSRFKPSVTSCQPVYKCPLLSNSSNSIYICTFHPD